MAHLSLRVLGPFQVTFDDKDVSGFASDKVRALLAYLVLSPDRPHRREALAGLLWPESPERSARTNLRNALANLRQVIRDHAVSPPFLHSTRQTIQFNGQSDYWLDADAFEDLVALLPSTSVHLEQAVSLVQGYFLEGFTLADAAPFEEWLLLRREHFHRQVIEALDRLAAIHERRGAYELALPHAWRRVELEPWQEEGQQQLMRLLALTGRGAQALASYQTHRRALAEELGVEPDPETTRLYEQVCKGELELPTTAPALDRDLQPPSRLPGFLEQEADPVELPVFVARERELAGLNASLDQALDGHGQVVFVTGGPGQGKTSLLTEFGRRAMEAHPDLLAAWGNCNAFSGIGDPYLPFRDIMAMLTGDVEARWLAGAVSTSQARRLWEAFPWAIQSLLQHGPHITGPLVTGQGLLSRAALWCATAADGPQSAAWLHQLRRRVERQQADPEGTGRSQLFQQVTNLLQSLTKVHPLLLVLDDLQWADTASVSLLFHLGRRLEGMRILIAGAYRADEVGLSRTSTRTQQMEPHPLEKVLNEFKRTYGGVWLDLAETGASERRHFVDALLETEPNRLGEEFRNELANRAGGHPLFTVELVRAMQARGDLVQDGTGFWTEGPVLDWEVLPVRVEGAIEARIRQLEPELREILSVASIEGEDFTIQVVAQLLGMEESMLLRLVAQDLTRRHKLVTEQADVQIGPKRVYRFKFGHVLIQNYLYQQFSPAERQVLHGKVAAAMERCCGDYVDEFAVQLARHHERAGNDGRALHYFTQAAETAHRVYANDAAYTHYTRAIEAAKRVSVDAPSLIRLYLGRGLAYQILGEFDCSLADYESALHLARGAGEADVEHLEWRALLDLGRLWTARDYSRAHGHFRDALRLAHQIGEPMLLAGSLNWIGNWYLNAEDPRAAITHHQQALAIFEQLEDRRGLATTLDLLGVASLLGGDITAMVQYYGRAILLFRELGDQPNLALSLTGRGHAACSTYPLLTLVPSAVPIHPRRDLEEALRLAREIGCPATEAWVLWSVGLLSIAQGLYGRALEAALNCLEIATQIEHRESLVTGQCVLGLLYMELLTPEEARRHLQEALALAEELHNRALIRWVAGTLAASHCQSGDLRAAQSCLDTVLSADTPMDTMYVRYCWGRQAELALSQGNPGLALDIVERLIDSAPGMSPGRVITFLWKLKGEALAAMGATEEPQTLLRSAINHARATGERFLLWRLHASLGHLYHASCRQAAAEEEFSTARELVEELAGTLPNTELGDSLRQRSQVAWPANAGLRS